MKYTKDAQDWKTKLNICNDGYINGSLVNLLQIALPITSYNRLLDWKLVYRDGNAGNIAVRASKWAEVGVGGVILAKKKDHHPLLDTTQI